MNKEQTPVVNDVSDVIELSPELLGEVAGGGGVDSWGRESPEPIKS